MTKDKTTRMLTEAGVMIAIALVLGLIKPYELPNGGAVSLEMLPLLLFCARWGVGPSAIACTAFGILQIFVQGVISYGWISIILDYILASTVLCLAGLGEGKPGGIYWGGVLGAAAKFACHFISGVTVWRIMAPTEVLGMTIADPYLYSFVYNISYVGVDLLLCLVIFALASKALGKYYTGADLK